MDLHCFLPGPGKIFCLRIDHLPAYPFLPPRCDSGSVDFVNVEMVQDCIFTHLNLSLAQLQGSLSQVALDESPILPIISRMVTESCCLCRLPPLRSLYLASTGMTTLTSHTTTPLTTVSSAVTRTRPPLEATPSSSAARSLRPALRTCTLTPLLAARKCSHLPTGSSYNPATACLWLSAVDVL